MVPRFSTQRYKDFAKAFARLEAEVSGMKLENERLGYLFLAS